MSYHNFLFDGSFPGFLSAVHSALEASVPEAGFTCAGDVGLTLFGPCHTITTNISLARRVWEDLGLKGTRTQKRVYYGFLHKNQKLLPVVYQYIAGVLLPGKQGMDPAASAKEAELELAALSVSREREEMEKKLYFQVNEEGVWYCEISPDHNVLPLLSRFCRNRFRSDPWLLVDTRRNQCLRSAGDGLVISPVSFGRRSHRPYVA